MGDAVLSAFLQVLFQAISDFVKEEMQLEHRVEKERKRLIFNLDMIQVILREAEKKTEELSEPQKLLFARLKDASYCGMEALDECLYEFQRRQVIHFANFRNSRVCSALNPLRMNFNHGMENKMMEFASRIGCIKELKEIYLAFQVDVQGHRGQHCEGSSLNPTTLLPPPVVCPRQHDCDEIVHTLLQPYVKSNVAVLPILGEPFIGKTTVAQLVLNLERVSTHFELKLWVHVSHNLNTERITSSIIESRDFAFHCDNLNALQMQLEKLLRGRRYLLVLDGYRSESWQDWDKLKRSFVSGARESKIIVTTIKRKVAEFLGTLGPYKLQRLRDEDCWLLFCKCARGTESYRDIQDRRLKEEVLQKCKGVPFIAVRLGNIINQYQEDDPSKWADILRKENWDSSADDFNKALRLSYAQLDYHLKPCFAYSSIIPQEFQIEEERLIQHWMAQGFIVPNPDTGEIKTMEDIGRSYLSSLVSQSFFQRANVAPTGQQHSYWLSEMMHHLASRVSGADCKCYIMGQPSNIPEKVQYLAVVFKDLPNTDLFEVISCGKFLRALIVLGGREDIKLRIPHDIGERFTRLRTLDLSNFGVTDLPGSIGRMRHLRCLQLQGTKIKCLPKSISNLYHLQTLGLRNCHELEELPHELKNLRKLRHIDLVMSRDPHNNVISLRCMPKDIGLLTDLQILSRFVVSKRSSIYPHRASIGELANLNNLHGKLIISNLHLVKDVQEAAQAQLASKQFLQELELSWSDDNNKEKDEQTSEHLKMPTIIELASKKFTRKLDQNEQVEKILENLKAPTTIKEITISGFTGESCPPWFGSADYTSLVTVSLYDFRSCCFLPPLGLLPHLENLHLKGWDRLISMNCKEFCGRSHKASFQFLKKLHLERMHRLQRWDGNERCAAFPNLLDLVLENCFKLEQVTHVFPSLTKITVEGSPALHGLPKFPSLKHVNVNASGEWIWGSWSSLSSPISITLCKLPTVHFPSGLVPFHSSLQRLDISHCEQLVSIPDDWPPCKLIHFSVRHCPRLHKLPKGIQNLQDLENMEIIDCEKLSCLPEMNGLISLIRLEIAGCGSIWSLPHAGFPSSMQVLSISRCPQLVQSCKNVGTDKAKILKIFSVWIDGHEMSSC